jgi:hypothetical protein
MLVIGNRVQTTWCYPMYSEKDIFLFLENCGEMQWTLCFAGVSDPFKLFLYHDKNQDLSRLNFLCFTLKS